MLILELHIVTTKFWNGKWTTKLVSVVGAHIHVLCNITPRSSAFRSFVLRFRSAAVRPIIFSFFNTVSIFLLYFSDSLTSSVFWASVSCTLTLFLLSNCILILRHHFSCVAHQTSLRIRRTLHSLCLSIKPGNPLAHFQLWYKQRVNIPLAETKHHQGHNRAHITHFHSK
jgi:hypothetical protein